MRGDLRHDALDRALDDVSESYNDLCGHRTSPQKRRDRYITALDADPGEVARVFRSALEPEPTAIITTTGETPCP